MTKYKLRIFDEGRYPRETILEIVDSNTKKSVLGPIYTVGLFETYKNHDIHKRIPQILQSQAFEDKILTLIVDDKVRFIDMVLDDYNIKYFTRNPDFYMYEFNLTFSECIPVIIPK